MVVAQLMIVGVSALIGGLILSSARSRHSRAQRLSELLTGETGETTAAGGETRTVKGSVEVDTPAKPGRRPPEHYSPEQPNEATPALWAWRVQREREAEQGSNTWKTIDSGLAVGEFTVRDSWEQIRIDSESVRPEEIDDPFASDHLFLGDPEIDEYVGERNGLLDRLGGDYGPLKDIEFTISVGTKTTTPNKYQATVIRDGEEMLARGRVEDWSGEPVLRAGEQGIEIAVGNLSNRVERMNSAARTRAIVGASVLVLGIGTAVTTLVF